MILKEANLKIVLGPDGSAPVDVMLRRFGEAFLALQERPNLGLTESAVAPGSTDAADPAGRGPSGHSLGVHAKQRSHLAGRQQTISSVHNPSLRRDVRPLHHRETVMSDKRQFTPSWAG
jgi:hypothetical protein